MIGGFGDVVVCRLELKPSLDVYLPGESQGREQRLVEGADIRQPRYPQVDMVVAPWHD